MQEHVVFKTASSRGWNEPGLEALSRLASDIFGRAPIHEAGSQLDVGLHKRYLWCEAEAIFGFRRISFVHCHR